MLATMTIRDHEKAKNMQLPARCHGVLKAGNCCRWSCLLGIFSFCEFIENYIAKYSPPIQKKFSRVTFCFASFRFISTTTPLEKPSSPQHSIESIVNDSILATELLLQSHFPPIPWLHLI